MAFSVENSQANSFTTSAPGNFHSYSYTIGASANLLIVMWYSQDPTTNAGMTWNGTSMTKQYTDGGFEVWYLTSPASGAHTLASTSNTGNGQYITFSLNGASTSSPFDAHQYTTGSNIHADTGLSDTITTVTDGAITLEQVATTGGTGGNLGTPANSQTQVTPEGSNTSYEYSGAYKTTGTAGSQTLGWNATNTYPPNTYNYFHEMVAIKPDALAVSVNDSSTVTESVSIVTTLINENSGDQYAGQSGWVSGLYLYTP